MVLVIVPQGILVRFTRDTILFLAYLVLYICIVLVCGWIQVIAPNTVVFKPKPIFIEGPI